MGGNGPGETFYVVASTDMERANIMITRVVEQIGALPELKATGTLSVTAKQVMPRLAERAVTTEQQVHDLADRVTEMIMQDLGCKHPITKKEN